MVRSSLCDYSDACLLVKRNISVNNTVAQSAATNNTNEKATFQNCAPFTKCISRINKIDIDNAQDIDILMPL